jgi:holo-[acyl-carrier protein] synthase
MKGAAGHFATVRFVIVGAGIDVLEIARLERALARRGTRMLDRLYTPRERADCDRRGRPLPHLALRFAVKEAGMKAIGTGWRRGVAWRDFETIETSRGLELELRGQALEIARARGFARAWVGASFTHTHALAQVVLEGCGRE